MFETILFSLSALLAVGAAIMVTISRNIIHASVYLLASLIGVAGLYATLGADFVAATQLVVYVGGVVILMLFAIMLTGGTNLKSISRFGITKDHSMGSIKTYLIAIISTSVIFTIIAKLIINVLGESTVRVPMEISSTVEKIGNLLVTKHLLAFEISSVLLLGALVGAAIIARPSQAEEV